MSSKWITPNVKQIWVSLPTLLCKTGIGMMQGSLSCLHAAMKAPDSSFKMDIHTSSWFAATLGLAGLSGLPLVALMMDRCGRRITFFAFTVPGAVGMILIGFTSHLPLMFLGRAFCGFCAASTSCLGAVVVGEYTCPENRGLLLNIRTTCLTVGSLICLILGHFFHWRTVTLFSATPFALSLLITYTWPESPFWLAENKKFKKSEEAFYWLRGKSEDTTREIKHLQRSQKDNQKRTLSEKCVKFLNKFKKKNFLKPAFIIIISFLLLEVSGSHIFPTYAIALVEDITSGNANPFYYNITIHVLIVISGTISAVLIKTIGVRKLLFVTGTATVIVVFLACLLQYLVSNDIISNSYAWLPLFLYVAFFFLSNLGCTSIPLALVGEIFPLEHRAFGSSISGYCLCIFLSISLKILPYMVKQFMIYGTFAILGVCIAMCLIILYFLIPETKNRTLQEIEDFWNYGKFKDFVKNNEEDLEKTNGNNVPLLSPTIVLSVEKEDK